ncbi:MAG: FAD binding domain-containing protein [Rhodospirillales bacterium]|nr:FAD binding domain-containing protein [Rhodospirillales bacterium]
MKPNNFNYVRAESVDHVLSCLAEHGENARILAGGQSLIAMMNFRLVEPAYLIDISDLDELKEIKLNGNSVEISAAVTQAKVISAPDVNEYLPLLVDALHNVGHFQTRTKGTFCGSIAHADPSSEQPLCFAVLGGKTVLKSKRGERVVPVSDFQTGLMATAREDDELLSSVRLPVQNPSAGYAFEEVTRRQGDFAIVAIAVIAEGKNIRIGVGGVAGRPEVRNWDNLADGDIDEALNAFAWKLGDNEDIHASAKYRRQLVRRIGRRVIEKARKCRS